MKRNLKALGLALVAVVAMSAIVAQAAQAKFDTLRTTGGVNAFVKAEADPTEPNQVFNTGGGFAVTCKTVETTGATISDKATEVTGHPAYGECTNSIGGSASVNTHGNSCHYLFTGETDANEMAEVHVTGCTEPITITTAGCVITITNEQTLNGVHYTNVETGGGGMDVTVNATVEGIMWTSNQAFGCSLAGIGKEGNNGTYKGKSTISGKEDNNKEEGAGAVGITFETLSTSTMP